MANVTKRGNSYRITTSLGYNANGKQIRKSMTYTPAPGMTEKQLEKEVERQAFIFEEKCRTGRILDGNIKFADFAERWFSDYASRQLKAKTVEGYKALMGRINAAIGHISLDKLQPLHLMEFYKNLSENGIRQDIRYKATPLFMETMKHNRLTVAKLSELSGVSTSTITSCRLERAVMHESAEALSRALKTDASKLFIPLDKDNRLTSNTILHHHRLISAILNTAVHWQVITANPCARVKPPKLDRKEAHYLDDNQTLELLECLSREELKYQVMIKLLIYSGVRRGELCGLKWGDIDFDNKLVTIERAVLYTADKGLYEDTPKNESSKRVVKLADEIFSLLQEYKMKYNADRVNAGDRWIETGYIFTQWNGKPIHPDTITGWFGKFIKAHSLPKVSIHSLRHTNATLMIANGVDLRTVSKRLGHSNMSTTANIYTHAVKSADERAAEVLQDILKPKQKNNKAN